MANISRRPLHPGSGGPILFRAMFHLTRRERVLIAGVLLAFLTGLAVKHYRDLETPGTIFTTDQRDAKR